MNKLLKKKQTTRIIACSFSTFIGLSFAVFILNYNQAILEIMFSEVTNGHVFLQFIICAAGVGIALAFMSFSFHVIGKSWLGGISEKEFNKLILEENLNPVLVQKFKQSLKSTDGKYHEFTEIEKSEMTYGVYVSHVEHFYNKNSIPLDDVLELVSVDKKAKEMISQKE